MVMTATSMMSKTCSFSLGPGDLEVRFPKPVLLINDSVYAASMNVPYSHLLGKALPSKTCEKDGTTHHSVRKQPHAHRCDRAVLQCLHI